MMKRMAKCSQSLLVLDSEDTEYLPDIEDSPPDELSCSGKKRK